MARVAHVGCGYWGRNLVRNFAEMNMLAAVVDEHPETAARISAEHGVAARTLAEVLADPAIDAVSIATPAETHADVALKAFAAGKHVFVEKPLALTARESLAMIAAAEKAGRRLMVGHLLQYHPVFRAMLSLVSAGRIGDLNYVYSNRMSLGKLRVEEDVLWSFAPHDLSMILALTGSAPVGVTAQGGAFATAGIADWATVQLVFPGNVRGHVQVSWLHPFKEQRLVAIGTKGALVFEDSAAEWGRKLAFYPHEIDATGPVPMPRKGDVEFIFVDKAEPLREECRHFVDCIDNGLRPRTDGAEGMAVLEVLVRAGDALKSSLAENGLGD